MMYFETIHVFLISFCKFPVDLKNYPFVYSKEMFQFISVSFVRGFIISRSISGAHVTNIE